MFAGGEPVMVGAMHGGSPRAEAPVAEHNGGVGAREGVPEGTVTFVMTDIESSTRLWAERPDDMAVAVPRHYEILDRAVAAHGGVRPVEQGEGDSVVAVFAGAADAVAAAAAAQRTLAEELPWLRVRMAVHTGEALLRDEGNYAGPSIIRCARIRSCGHGGQVLVSDTTATLVVDALADDLCLQDLGVARLRDLARPERVWQVDAPGLGSSFPPLRSLDAAPNNLPVPLSSLIGRERELAEVGGLLRGHRLVTLTGSGGAGKTRLAQQVAADAVELHEGGSWWVELAPLSSATQLGERTLEVVGLRSVATGGDPIAALGRQLRSQGPTLLVLDNAEHVIDAVAELAHALLEACPDVRLLVTSREPLGVPGEVVWRVPSLQTPAADAVVPAEGLFDHAATRLFVERALDARPNLVLDAAGAAAVVTICARLDGIPLAIELAAARARTMPLDRLAAGLDDAFRLLTGGARTALPRQQTLLASIAWSVDLLDERDDAVFRRLAVFAAPFTIDAAEAVTADGELVDRFDVLDSLARLVDKSLVQLDEASGRYRLLETVRQWGLDRLRQRGELAASRTRHAEWCAQWAEEVRALRHGIDAEPLVATVPDVLAALDWSMAGEPEVVLRVCAGLGRFISILGPSMCHRMFDWVLALDPDEVDRVRWASAIDTLAMGALMLDRLDILPLVPVATSALDDAGLTAGVGLRSIEQMPEILHGRCEAMESLCRESVERGDDLNTKWLAGAITVFAAFAGDLPRAHRHLEILEVVLRRWNLPMTPDAAGFGYVGAVQLAILEGRLDAGRELARRALAGTSRTDHSVPAAMVTVTLGLLMDDDELLTVPTSWVDHEVPARFRHPLAGLRSMLAWRAGSCSAAADHATEAWVAGRMNGVIGSSGAVLAVTVLLDDDRVEAARDLIASCANEAGGDGVAPLPAAVAHHASALLARHEGRDSDAADAAHALLELAHRSGFVLSVIDALLVLVDVGARRVDRRTAARLAGATRAARDRIGYRGPLVGRPGELDALVEQLAHEEPEAFAEGHELDLDAAVAYAQRMRGERGRPTFGWGSLTPTEQQVTELAASGSTNAQIAERLLMKPATVKTHLTHVFAKLGVANRTELAHTWASQRSHT
jgi:predicted ATPase/DNA-binding CsgD family transcriptional regulator